MNEWMNEWMNERWKEEGETNGQKEEGRKMQEKSMKEGKEGRRSREPIWSMSAECL